MAFPVQLISTAFVREQDQIEIVALDVGTVTGPVITLTTGEDTHEVEVTGTAAFTETLTRDDLTCRDGQAVGLYHPTRGLLALLAGPTELPERLQITAAVDVASTVPTVVCGGTEDEEWLVFETTPTKSDRTTTRTPQAATTT